MVLPRVVLCTWFWNMEFLFSGRTMVLPGIERYSGPRVGDKKGGSVHQVFNYGIFY